MSNNIFPKDSCEMWLPTAEELVKSIIVVVGCKGTGKTTMIKSLENENVVVEEVQQKKLDNPDGETVCSVYSFESFLDTVPADRSKIDYLVFCGVPSSRDVERIFERYQHLFDISQKQLYQMTQQVIHHYYCLVIDISAQVRIGNKKACFYKYKAETK